MDISIYSTPSSISSGKSSSIDNVVVHMTEQALLLWRATLLPFAEDIENLIRTGDRQHQLLLEMLVFYHIEETSSAYALSVRALALQICVSVCNTTTVKLNRPQFCHGMAQYMLGRMGYISALPHAYVRSGPFFALIIECFDNLYSKVAVYTSPAGASAFLGFAINTTVKNLRRYIDLCLCEDAIHSRHESFDCNIHTCDQYLHGSFTLLASLFKLLKTSDKNAAYGADAVLKLKVFIHRL